jgi:hypothetical protein
MMNDILSSVQINEFISKGYVKLADVFPRKIADEARQILWTDIGWDPDDPATWQKPVVRLGDYSEGPFREAVNAPFLHGTFDMLVGKGRWIPRQGLGTFLVRFPVLPDPEDTGWHVDASFPGDDPNDFFTWRINIFSKGRALLMLFLFSDTGEDDAPTRIIPGSHHEVARILEPYGEEGLSFMELAERLKPSPEGKVEFATGMAGTVYLCHPFLVHAAQPHRGSQPRFMAQPPLSLKEELRLNRSDNQYSPVETAVRMATGKAD